VKRLLVTPCFSGHTPVSIDDHAGPLTEGVVVRVWAVNEPAAASASIFGVDTSASTSARTPSMPISKTLGVRSSSGVSARGGSLPHAVAAGRIRRIAKTGPIRARCGCALGCRNRFISTLSEGFRTPAGGVGHE